MNFRTPLLVGFVLVTAVSGLTWFAMSTTKDKFDDDSTYMLHADFTDASGIRDKTRVQINGIDVGKIAAIKHVRGANGRLMARVSLRIGKDYEVYDNANLRKAAESLLGDFRLDLDPGTPTGKKLQEGDTIPQVNSLSDIDEIKSQLLQVSRHVNDVTEAFSKVLASPEGEGSLKSILNKVENSMAAIEATTQTLQHTIGSNDKILTDIIHNVGAVTQALAKISEPGGDMVTMAHNLALLSSKLDKIADSVGGLITGDQADAGTALAAADPQGATQAASLRSTMENLNDSIRSINAITKKIDEGQGTLGRVVNDSGIADRVESTLDSANEIIGSIAGLETQIELRSEYGVPFYGSNNEVNAAIKNTLGLRIMPKPDKYYILEAISDPRGRTTRTLTTSVVNTGGKSQTIATDESEIAFNALKFSAQLAKRYYFATLRFGIIENTGGLGLNLHGFDDRGELRMDAYDFDRRDPNNARSIFPRLRATAMYAVVSHVSVQLGIDDPLNQKLRTWFLGGVLRFTDDDLKAFLIVAPK